MAGKCKFCGKESNKIRSRSICNKCFDDNIEGCKTEYNRKYKKCLPNIECRFKCGRKTRNHETKICITCSRSTRRENEIGFSDNWVQNRRQHEARWKRLGIIYTEEQLTRHITITQCDLCGADLQVYRAMDHDHETNHYRGTLCRKCNTGLGQLGDDLAEIIKLVQIYKDRTSSA